MNISDFIRSESERYPEHITQKEMAALLGICKSKAYAIQRQGHISFEYANTDEGRRQQIKTADILRYQYEQMRFNSGDEEFASLLRLYFEKQLRPYPQLLFVADVRRFTGYAKTTVNNWIDRKLLKALCYKKQRIKSPQLGKGTIITKEAFIAFLTSPYYRGIRRKSTLHKEQAKDCETLFTSLLAKRGVANG
ncbi:conserved hypothetical protein [uncultured Eubacteriales bacterium]|uniref:Helix-turn-helix domain-containing protein n=1 Tax=uncultured Eubacteriales bacterium TaxID=172733 RepID=A0A212JMI4_9FIRM|nr:conserved hypothetical protein [uncultured Eubacteriales bacterium]